MRYASPDSGGRFACLFRQGRLSVSLVPACLLGNGGAGSVTVALSSSAESDTTVLTETLDLALILEPEEATKPLLRRMCQCTTRQLLPVRRLRVNRREVKQVYNKYKPKKRTVPPPEPFEPEDQFLDFVHLLDPLAPQSSGGP